MVSVGHDGRVHPLFCRARRGRYRNLWLRNPPSRPYQPQSFLTFQADDAAKELRPLGGKRAGRRRARGEIALRARPAGKGPCRRPVPGATSPPDDRPALNPAPKFDSAHYVTWGKRCERRTRMAKREAVAVLSAVFAFQFGASAAAQEDESANTSVRPDTAT